MKKQLTLKFNQYIPVSVGNTYLFTHYEAINNFIRQNLRPELHDLLLKPIKRQSEVDFWSDNERTYHELKNYSSEAQSDVLKHYNAATYEIKEYANRLKSTGREEDYKWGELLLKSFDIDNHIILTDGQQFKLVWGWQFSNKTSYELPMEAFSFLLPAILSANEPTSEILVVEQHHEEVGEMVESDDYEIHSEPENVPEPARPQEIEQETPKDENLAPTSSKKRTPVPPTSNGFTQFLDHIEGFGKKYWWLLLILLLLLVWILMRSCNASPAKSASEMTPEELNKAYHEIIPPQQRSRIRPVDPGDIIDDDDSKSKVVGNVLNIALKKKNDNFQQFSVALKQAFPEDKYQIVYYDEETRRLQLEFPENERQGMKNKIKTTLTPYEMLIWDEAVFNSMRTFNDPSFQDNMKFGPWKAINAPIAWDYTTGDTSVVIAIIDDGFDVNHVELKTRIVKPYNVINHNRVITCGPDKKHGTHVAGIIGAVGNNSKGITGVAPNCLLMPIQASGQGGGFYMTDVVDGILYAIKNNADVINMSLGKWYTDDIKNLTPYQQQQFMNQYGQDESAFWNELFQMAEDNKVTVVIAAGNQNLMVGMDPMQRSDKVIKIAACDNTKNKANFSNYFKTLVNNGSCLSAPGVSIYSTLPGNQFGYMDGTSMASPMVAGVIGLMKSANKNLTNKQIMRILYDTGQNQQQQKIGPVVQSDKAVKKAKAL